MALKTGGCPVILQQSYSGFCLCMQQYFMAKIVHYLLPFYQIFCSTLIYDISPTDKAISCNKNQFLNAEWFDFGRETDERTLGQFLRTRGRGRILVLFKRNRSNASLFDQRCAASGWPYVWIWKVNPIPPKNNCIVQIFQVDNMNVQSGNKKDPAFYGSVFKVFLRKFGEGSSMTGSVTNYKTMLCRLVFPKKILRSDSVN